MDKAKKIDYLNIRAIIEEKIKENGGWVNGHAHLDRAYSVTPDLYKQANAYRHEKWKLNAELRRTSTTEQIYDRIAFATENMLAQGIVATASFIDCDYDVKDKAIKAAMKAREAYPDMTYKFMNQSSYGILTKETREWFEYSMDFVDIVGGLMKADAGHEDEHLDIIMSAAKSRNKMIHMHIDELNLPEEHETELLARKTIEHGMQGKVVGVHGISIQARPKEERYKIYDLAKKAELMFVSCPISWLNARRSEELAPIHNPSTPVDEMVPEGITVAVGLDNIADIFMPLNDADIWNDMRALIEMNRFYEIDEIVKIATVNGRKVLGIK